VLADLKAGHINGRVVLDLSGKHGA
jgi:hypothetical protein